jgi:hypothetical protein
LARASLQENFSFPREIDNLSQAVMLRGNIPDAALHNPYPVYQQIA